MKVNGPEIKSSFLVILLFVKAYFVQLQWQIIECQKRRLHANFGWTRARHCFESNLTKTNNRKARCCLTRC